MMFEVFDATTAETVSYRGDEGGALLLAQLLSITTGSMHDYDLTNTEDGDPIY